jgi:SAM-dependent methyltransferase
MHDEAFRYVVEQASKLNTEGLDVLDLGGRNVNGTTRELFRDAARYVSVDIRDGDGVDVVCDAADLDLGETFDVVVSTELLEHAERGAEIVAVARQHLKPGGKFIATMAGTGRRPHGASGEHDPPHGEFYRNVEPRTLSSWLCSAGFDVWQLDQAGPDLRCVAEVTGG